MMAISKRWYWVPVALVLAGIALGAILPVGLARLASKVESLHRVVMPGRVELALPAGKTTLYVEQKSRVDGEVYEVAEHFNFRCGVSDLTGKPIALEKSSSSVEYTVRDYAGSSAFDLHPDAAGTYVLSCKAPHPFVIAVGGGVGTPIVPSLLGVMILVPLGVCAYIVVLVLRILGRRLDRISGSGARSLKASDEASTPAHASVACKLEDQTGDIGVAPRSA